MEQALKVKIQPLNAEAFQRENSKEKSREPTLSDPTWNTSI
jgi:hypothetical protein